MTTTTATALTGTYLLDTAHSRLGFVARQALMVKVRGAFETFDGRAYLDFADPGRSIAEVAVEVGSLTTHNTRRDEHLRTSFFDVGNHPRITFRSTGVDQLEDDRFRLTGELTIRGRTRSVSIDFTCTGIDMAPDGTTRVAFHGRATLHRNDWGVSWNVALEGGGALVSNTIALELEVAAVKSGPAA